ncbi:hypothetical protein EB796_023579 [Bugula neritina]|uniref:Nucleolar 27S pre-rRNA processing Urb2/Npa2 C-terminal domain-containing protein n=1 Tax=Bugula neritina TaxID=10212 RepID=A0A7J7IXG7_BUGNE|nr:hypothetical protein EB796_023579 [Bugula neritina]
MFSVQGLDVDKEIHHVEKELICCCQQLQKVISLMSGYPQIFGKVSSFILSDVVHSLKSVTLLPNVKKYLYSALNGLFDLLDEFSSIMLKTNLKEAEREIFKAIYSQWEKYHKYTGKV